MKQVKYGSKKILKKKKKHQQYSCVEYETPKNKTVKMQKYRK